jgi:hypothetical protein
MFIGMNGDTSRTKSAERYPEQCESLPQYLHRVVFTHGVVSLFVCIVLQGARTRQRTMTKPPVTRGCSRTRAFGAPSPQAHGWRTAK